MYISSWMLFATLIQDSTPQLKACKGSDQLVSQIHARMQAHIPLLLYSVINDVLVWPLMYEALNIIAEKQ